MTLKSPKLLEAENKRLREEAQDAARDAAEWQHDYERTQRRLEEVWAALTPEQKIRLQYGWIFRD